MTRELWLSCVVHALLQLNRRSPIQLHYVIQVKSLLFHIRCKIDSSVASPICQEGQSEKTFPILTFSSRFFSFSRFSVIFPLFSPLFPDFDNFFAVKGATLPPCPYTGYATGSRCYATIMEKKIVGIPDTLTLIIAIIPVLANETQFRAIDTNLSYPHRRHHSILGTWPGSWHITMTWINIAWGRCKRFFLLNRTKCSNLVKDLWFQWSPFYRSTHFLWLYYSCIYL